MVSSIPEFVEADRLGNVQPCRGREQQARPMTNCDEGDSCWRLPDAGDITHTGLCVRRCLGESEAAGQRLVASGGILTSWRWSIEART